MTAHRVVVHGLKNFCPRLLQLLQSEAWDVRYHGVENIRSLGALVRDMWRADLLYTWGGRVSLGKFLWTAKSLRKENLVMFWSGSDVLYAQEQHAQGKTEPWVAGKTHWAGAPWLAEEVKALGLKCEYVPSTWVEVPQTPIPLPKKFSVLVYLPALDRTQLYGIDRVIEVASALPEIEFRLVGVKSGRVPGSPANLQYVYEAGGTEEMYRDTTVLWRPVRHDGLSFMALEALGYGRYVLWTYPFEGSVQTQTADEAKAEIQKLHIAHQSGTLQWNERGMQVISKDFSPAVIRNNILQRWKKIESHKENVRP